jgi:hypothetical protein
VHHRLRELLETAEGESKFVIALNLDIRGFSDWTKDPAQSALYLKKLYTHLFDTYFSTASMVKPTGDGLMVVKTIDEDDLEEVAKQTIVDAVEIVERFEAMTAGARMINFDVPDQVGIGIARGSAARLVSEDATLDYSGRVLNLASRLMDLARPFGLVVDEGFGTDFFPQELADQFKEEEVYLQGVSPRDPVSVFCWPDDVEIPESSRHPLDDPALEHVTHECTLSDLKAMNFPLALPLPSRPPDPNSLECKVRHDRVLPGRRASKDYYAFYPIDVEVIELEGRPLGKIDVAGLISYLQDAGVRENWPIRLKVSYRPG